MWIIVEKKMGMPVRYIGPFHSAQEAALWVSEKYTKRLGTTACIEQIVAPEVAAKPNG